MVCVASAALAYASASRVLIRGDSLIFRDGSGNELKWQAGSTIASGTLTISNGIGMGDNPITDVGYMDFNTSNGIPAAEGRMVWNDDDGTLNIGLKGGNVNLQSGMELVLRGKNDTGAIIIDGQTVYISGGSGSFPLYALTNASVSAKSEAIGIATEDSANNSFGYVTTSGLVREIDTSGATMGESWTAGDSLFIFNTPGTYTNVMPINDVRKEHIAHVVRAHATEGVLWVHPHSHPYFSELSGAELTQGSVVFIDAFANTTEDNSFLYYDDTNNRLSVGTNAGTLTNSVTANTFVLNSPRWDDIRMPATSARPGASSPGFDVGNVSNSVGAYCFDKTTDQELYFLTQVPHKYQEGSSVELHIHWFPNDAGAGDVTWVAETNWANIGDTWGTNFFNTSIDAADTVQYKHQYHDMAWFDGTGKDVSSMLAVHLYRDANADSDTYDDDACLIEVDFHYRTDTPGGSDLENSKL
jgi:hypothetical protein